MAKQYWLKREGKTYGPYSGGKLKKLAGEGTIGPNDLISTDRRAWQLAEMVRGLSLRAMAKPPQTASMASDLSSHEVLPETGTASYTHEQRFPSRPSRTKWIVMGVAGIATVGLVVAVAVWLWMPQGESMAPGVILADEGDIPGPQFLVKISAKRVTNLARRYRRTNERRHKFPLGEFVRSGTYEHRHPCFAADLLKCGPYVPA